MLLLLYYISSFYQVEYNFIRFLQFYVCLVLSWCVMICDYDCDYCGYCDYYDYGYCGYYGYGFGFGYLNPAVL